MTSANVEKSRVIYEVSVTDKGGIVTMIWTNGKVLR